MVVIGNPNAGKTTIFNRLTGLSQKVGNYPGVTVERKNGSCIIDGEAIQLVDLPGTYSLAAHSPDEMVTVDVILGHQVGESKPDLVLEIVDASNLERNLYLLSQVLDLGLPAVVALNMTDIAEARGIRVDPAALSRRLGVDVVPVQGHTGRGIRELKKAIAERLRSLGNGAGGEAGAGMRNGSSGRLMLDATLLETVNDLQVELGPKFLTAKGRDLHPFEVLRALVDRGASASRAASLGRGRSGRAGASASTGWSPTRSSAW